MNKAELQRALKLAAGNTLKPIRALDKSTAEVFDVLNLKFDAEDDCFYLELELYEVED